MSKARVHVAVVGGGAAGIFGAIACAEANPGVRITVLEAGAGPLSKVKISGGGRCNVTHACFDPVELVTHYPRGHRALRGPFQRFQPQDTVQWFEQRGVTLKTEADGRMFPTSDHSQTIIDCLLDQLAHHRIELRTRTPVVSVQLSHADNSSDNSFGANNVTSNKDASNHKADAQPSDDTASEDSVPHFRLQLKSGETLSCDRLLLATGSNPQGYRIAQSLGHQISPPVPSLCTFTINVPELRALAGIAIAPARARLMLPNAKPLEQTGPILLTHWGLSGPAVLKLSAWGARDLHECGYQAPLRVTWVPDETQDSLRQHLLTIKAEWAKKTIASISPIDLPRRFWKYLLTRTEINLQIRWADLPKKSLNRLVQTLMQDTYNIQSKGVFKDEFVTCGGIQLKEVNFKTMESRYCPGLFFAGEILDIDGVTGGFNFQNAWTTGWLAGQALA